MDTMIPSSVQQNLQRDKSIFEKIQVTSSFNSFLQQAEITSLSFFSEISNLLNTDKPESTRENVLQECFPKKEIGKEHCQLSNIPCLEIFDITGIQNQAVSVQTPEPLNQDKAEINTSNPDSVPLHQIAFSFKEKVAKNCVISDVPLSGFSPEKISFNLVKEGPSSEKDFLINKANEHIWEDFHLEQEDIKISDQQPDSGINLFFRNRGQDLLRHSPSITDGIKIPLNYLDHSSNLIRVFKDRESFGDIEADVQKAVFSDFIGLRGSENSIKEFMRFAQNHDIRIQKIEELSSYPEKDIHVIKVSVEPDGLGRLEISLSTQKGTIKGYIHAFDLHSREVIERNLLNIISMLEREGINIGSLTVGLGREGRYGNGEKERLFNFKNRIEGHGELLNPHYEGLKHEPLIRGLSIFV